MQHGARQPRCASCQCSTGGGLERAVGGAGGGGEQRIRQRQQQRDCDMVVLDLRNISTDAYNTMSTAKMDSSAALQLRLAHHVLAGGRQRAAAATARWPAHRQLRIPHGLQLLPFRRLLQVACKKGGPFLAAQALAEEVEAPQAAVRISSSPEGVKELQKLCHRGYI